MKISESRWRNIAAPIIAAVLEKYPDRGKDQDAALREAYPFGPRKYYPYKIWLDEVKQQKRGRGIVLVRDSRKLVFGSMSDPYGDKLNREVRP